MSEKNEKIQEEKDQSTEVETTEENNDSKIKELEDKLLRALAENENLRRRYEKEVKEAEDAEAAAVPHPLPPLRR